MVEVAIRRLDGHPYDAQMLACALLSNRFQHGEFELSYQVDSGNEISRIEGLGPDTKLMRESLRYKTK